MIRKTRNAMQRKFVRAAAYGRYSSENQRDESIDAQFREIEKYAKNNNIMIVKWYADKAKTATTDQRPEFLKMIQESALDEFDVVIVHKLDRFSRDEYDAIFYKKKLENNDVKLISVTENLGDSPEAALFKEIIHGYNAFYSKN